MSYDPRDFVTKNLTVGFIKMVARMNSGVNEDVTGLDDMDDTRRLIFTVSILAKNGIYVDKGMNLYLEDYGGVPRKLKIGKIGPNGELTVRTLKGDRKVELENVLKNKELFRSIAIHLKEFET